MAPNPHLIIDLEPSEAGSEIVRTVVLPWSGQSVPLRIPGGLSDGTVLRLPGIGPATMPGGPPGDAYLQVRIVPGGAGAVPAAFGAAPFGAPPPVPPVTSAPPTAPFGAPGPTSFDGPPTTPFGAGPPVTSAPPGTPFGAAPPTAPFGGPAAQFGNPPPGGPPQFGGPPFGASQPASGGSGRRKVLALVGGAVALMLLIALAVPLLFWVNNRDSDGKSSDTSASGGQAGESAPEVKPISAQEYQALLAEVDKAVAPGFTQLGGAKNPKAVGTAVTAIETALNQQIETLSKVVPPENAATAHADLLRGLEGLGDSLAETGSAAGAGEVCLGPSALARISREAAIEDVRSAQQALTSADPAQPYQVGSFLPKKTADSNRRLGNGAYLKRVRSGQGELKIENGDSSDAVINLVPGSAKSAAVSVYVRAKGKHTVSGVKDGTYRIYMTSGKDWDGKAKAFARDCNFQRFEDSFKFTTTASQYTIWTISLTPVSGGNAQTSDVDPGAFPGS